MSPDRSSVSWRRIAVGFVALWAAGSIALGRVFTVLTPGAYDGQLFAYIGWMWRHGRLPYVHIWDNKPPGIWAVIAATFSVLPASFKSLAIVETLFAVGLVLTVVMLLRYLKAPTSAVIVGTVAAAVGSGLRVYNEGGNLTELYLLWPAALSIYFFIRAWDGDSMRWAVLAGVFASLATLFKPVGLAPFLAQSAFLLFAVLFTGARWGSSLRLWLADAAGTILPWIPWSWYFARHGAFGDMLDASFWFNVRYGVSHNQHFSILKEVTTASRLAPVTSLWTAALLGLVLFGVFRKELSRGPVSALGRWWPLVGLWLAADLSGALAGGNGFPHYFLAIAGSLAVAAAFTLWFLAEQFEHRPWLQAAAVVLVIGPLGFTQIADTARGLQEYVTRQEEKTPPANEAVADYLNRSASRSPSIFVWTYEPLIYFRTHATSPSRYLFAHHIYDSPAAYDSLGKTILDELHRDPPQYIVDREETFFRPLERNPVRQEFLRFVHQGYRQVYEAGYLKVYQRNGT